MLVMTIIADVRARTYDMLTALAMASVMQIMDNPYIICNTSYIMSFFAMLGIALVLPVISSADKTLVFIKKKNRKNRTLKDEVSFRTSRTCVDKMCMVYGRSSPLCT